MNNGITINEDDKYSGCQNTKIAGINVIIQKNTTLLIFLHNEISA